jgi:two-component system, OmpR family, phosphate regulon response regulator OmpR
VMQDLPHLLIVDDDARIRTLLSRYLRENDYHISQAEDAKHAKNLLSLFTFDLLILDVMMPEITGFELAHSIRKGETSAEKTIPLIILTAKGESESRIHGLEIGADDYLAKPFEPKDCCCALATCLNARSNPLFL